MNHFAINVLQLKKTYKMIHTSADIVIPKNLAFSKNMLSIVKSVVLTTV
jgi:hypothetical protein